jgi:apolipoprotein N-acyltransferase
MDAVLDLHTDLTANLLERSGPDAFDLVVWPEDSVAFDLRHDRETAHRVGELSAQANAPFLIGSTERPATGGRYNVSLVLDGADGQTIARYAKRHPVPFGEYIPWRSFARIFTKNVDRVSTDMLPGDEVGLMEIPIHRTGKTVPIGDVICFEVVYDSLVGDTVDAGAQLLVVQTNNASFGTTDQSVQQLAMTRLRAIEFGRAAVHISTTGVSALISPSGIVLDSLGAFTPGEMTADLPLRTSMTPAARWGRAISWTFAILGALAALSGFANTLTRRHHKDR